MSKSRRRFGEEEDNRNMFRGHRARGFSKAESQLQEAQTQAPPTQRRETTRQKT